MAELGSHILLDLDGCPEPLLADKAKLRFKLRQAALVAGATIVGEAFHDFDPPGVSGVMLIAESHLSIHTWPSEGKATVDVYTCGESFDAGQAADLLVEGLGATQHRRVEVSRGFSSSVLTEQIA